MLNLPREIVELILFHVACPTLPGRPVSLEAVQLTCKRLHHYVHSSNDLHAQIFRFKFSHSRHGRMQGLTSADWRAELAQVDQALAHVQNRRGLDPVLESNEDILWRLYIMCHDDDDGVNKLQLNAVNTYEWIQDFVLQHLYDGADSNGGWPAENAANSLALWILWFLTTKERLHLEPEAVSDRMVELVLPYVVAHFRYATAWAPPNHFHLPLPNQVVLSNRIRSTTHFLSFQTPHGPFPKYRRDGVEWNLPLFEHRVSLCVPLVSIAARLLYFVRRELYPFGMNPNLPATRALAPPNHTGPTLEDITELNRNRLGGTDGRGGGTRVGCSLAHSEWARLRNCLSPWCGSSALHMHPIGSLTGLFAGRMMMTNEPIVNHIVQNPELPAGFGEMMLGFTSAPIYARFEELHSYYGEDVLPCTRRPASGSGSSPPDLMDIDDSDQEDDDSSEAQFTAEETAELDALLEARFDDGMFNGFLPTNSMFTNSDLGRRVAISAPSLDHEYLYHRHGKSSIPHDPETCQGCSLRQAEMERRVDMDMDNERECRETLPPCSGVQDVIIRGSTDPNHAAAWNDYTYYGRVRKWDGMVIFVRLGPEKIVFYGYMTDDGNGLVGNWRIGVGEVGMPSLEGAFTMGKVHEDDESKQPTT